MCVHSYHVYIGSSFRGRATVWMWDQEHEGCAEAMLQLLLLQSSLGHHNGKSSLLIAVISQLFVDCGLPWLISDFCEALHSVPSFYNSLVSACIIASRSWIFRAFNIHSLLCISYQRKLNYHLGSTNTEQLLHYCVMSKDMKYCSQSPTIKACCTCEHCLKAGFDKPNVMKVGTTINPIRMCYWLQTA